MKLSKKINTELAKNQIKEKPNRKCPGSEACQLTLTSRAGENQTNCDKHDSRLSTGHS